MKRIKDERTRIDADKRTVGAAAFFNNRKHREDLEWLALSYLEEILLSVRWEAPEYAEKLTPPAPDFQTFRTPGIPFRRIEVTEILRPGYRRGEAYRKPAKSEVADFGCGFSHVSPPHPQPWASFQRVLRSKLAKSYAPGAWLLIYHDMWAFDFDGAMPWHERVLREIRTWTHDSGTTCDITQSRYENIFVVNSSGTAAVRLHPHWDVVKAASFP